MENEFKDVMSKKTNEELIKIITIERNKYNPIAIEAVETEIEKRNIDKKTFEEIREVESFKKTQKEKVDSNVVGSGIRFLNFIIDILVWALLAIIIISIIQLLFNFSNKIVIQFFESLVIFGTFIGYYIIMEIKLKKTIGKFITKTKVVKLNGENPDKLDIISRTLYRLIPFDQFSYLFVKNGIHDFLSKTKVIKDKLE